MNPQSDRHMLKSPSLGGVGEAVLPLGGRLEGALGVEGAAINNLQYLRIWLDPALNLYYLPYSTGFQGKTIRHIILYDPMTDDLVDTSGAPVFSLADNPAAGLFLNLKNEDDSDLVRDADLSLLASGNKAVFIPVGKPVKWENSYIRVRGALPEQPAVLLLYVVYDELRPAPRRYDVVKQVRIPTSATPQKLSAYVDATAYGNLRKLDVVSRTKLTGQNFITLNCRSGRTFNTVPLEFFQEGHGGLPRLQMPLRLADYNVDWNNSTIVNTDQEVLLNLYFGSKEQGVRSKE